MICYPTLGNFRRIRLASPFRFSCSYGCGINFMLLPSIFSFCCHRCSFSSIKSSNMFTTHADLRSLWQCFRTVNPLIQAALLPKASICTGLRFHSNLISNNSPRAKRLGTLDNSKNRRLSSRARRKFSTTAIVRHGRLSPPKAGEE